eukprot:CAMPEP_0113897480 /NCGR_PEP_ID=MMETSP0780_2-20120614/18711_1 /TAXON_ID=652834 /ORGANISM="Palpitomonas bilix" /LENGTH=347 /DNA_ID=CAMNT_0000888965 /DNA_START=120 /DNA_END=1163 /DNA_ORIENTATION=+ /assembly_acc=CAM_ASM_000599
MGVAKKLGWSVALTVLFSALSLLVAASKNSKGGYDYDKSLVVVLAEFAKLGLALITTAWMIARGTLKLQSVALRGSIRYCIPAIIYAVQNNLTLVAMGYLDAPTFQLFNNMKILSTGVAFWLFLKKELSRLQWLALCLLTIGMVTTQIEECKPGAEVSASAGMGKIMAGFLVSAGISGLSAFAGVYNEYLLKNSNEPISVQNLKLYIFSSALALVLYLGGWNRDGREATDSSVFAGFNIFVWMTVCVWSLVGLAVSAIMKYADNIVKLHAASASILLTAVISALALDFHLTLPFTLGFFTAVISVVLYYSPEAKPNGEGRKGKEGGEGRGTATSKESLEQSKKEDNV